MNRKKIISMILAASLFITGNISAVSASVKTASDKEEVVYIMTDGSGQVNDIYVVNILGSGDIVDYGDYSSVKMLTTNDNIHQEGDEIQYSTEASKSYYEGKLEEKNMPWDISIRYFIDGKEYSAEEVAGKSGNLEIKFKITENKNYSGDFYNSYALQTTFIFDTDKCSKIVSDYATIANVGNNKQLTYTILPGKGIETSITAKVNDFEMESIAINGLKLNLNIEVDDDALMEQVNELMEGVVKIDDGSIELNDGVATLKDGTYELKSGAGDLKSGVSSLNTGISSLQGGIKTVEAGIETLNSKSGDLVSGSSEVKQALLQIQEGVNGFAEIAEKLEVIIDAATGMGDSINSLYDGSKVIQSAVDFNSYKSSLTQYGVDVDNIYSKNAEAIANLNNQISTMETLISQLEGIPECEEQVATLKNQVGSLQNVIATINSNNGVISGTESYFNNISQSIEGLYDEILSIQDKLDSLKEVIAIFVNELNEAVKNLNALNNGINELTVKYGELHNGIVEYTDGVAALNSGYKEIVNGVATLAEGSNGLYSGASTLYSGVETLYKGTADLYDGSLELVDGTGEFRDKTSNMDTEVEEQINSILESVQGSDSDIVSFVSDKNTNVESVQFVIKTEAVKKLDVENTEIESVEELTIWQRFLKLFGL